MVDIVSIIIAIVSLLGALASAAFTGLITFYIDELKRKSDTKKLIHKYQDPLVLAAVDLQSRLQGLTRGLLDYRETDRKEFVDIYTAFLFGQYLSWVYILRRQAQFLCFSTDKKNTELNNLLDRIRDALAKDVPGEEPFMLWAPQQMAIGESMTEVGENGEIYCIGYAAFSHKYNTDAEFKHWFGAFEGDMAVLAEARKAKNIVASHRLRRLQHLLVDLMAALDPPRMDTLPPGWKWRVEPAAHMCACLDCPPAEPMGSFLVAPQKEKLSV